MANKSKNVQIHAEHSHRELAKDLVTYAEAKLPVRIVGRMGIGKSFAVREAAIEMAKRCGRRFVEWNNISTPDKMLYGGQLEGDLSKGSPTKDPVYIFADMRLTQMDSTSFGMQVPDPGRNFMRLIPQLLFLALSRQGAAGMLFLDEIGQADPSVQSAVHQLLGDRAMGDVTLSSEVSVVSAMNHAEDKNYQYEMAGTLRNRLCHIYLRTPTAREWLLEYAHPRGVHPLVSAFIECNPAHLMIDDGVDVFERDAFPTMRSWDYASRLLYTVLQGHSLSQLSDTVLCSINRVVASVVGPDCGASFAGYVSTVASYDLKKILADPETEIEKIEARKRNGAAWAFIPYLAETLKNEPLDLEPLSRWVSSFESGTMTRLGVGAELLAAALSMCLEGRRLSLEKRFGQKAAEEHSIKHFRNPGASSAEKVIAKAISSRAVMLYQ
jgi:hypothetical protein